MNPSYHRSTLFVVLQLLLWTMLATAQQQSQDQSSTTETPTIPPAPVATNGFHDDQNNEAPQQENWLKQHNRFVFVIVIGLLIVALILWYIVRSIKGMRKRLREENQAQTDMLQKFSTPPPPETLLQSQSSTDAAAAAASPQHANIHSSHLQQQTLK
ncbi:unnamed protein product [Absidia cylindrospora]